MSDALFEIRGAPALNVPDTLLGVWQPIPGANATSFGVEAAALPEPTVWSAALDPETADANLQQAQEQLQVTQNALREAGSRLDEFIQAQRGGAVFALEVETRAPESELSTMLSQLGMSNAAVGFGPLDFLNVDWNDVLERFQGFLAQLRQLLGDPLLVETRDRAQNTLVAQSAVRWTGHTQTALIDDPENLLRAQHVQTLALALGQRELLFRIAGLAAEGAGRLALIAAVPTNAFLMMPGIYKFITRVMDEYLKIRQQLGSGATEPQ